MKSKLLILGAGGHGKVVADIALQMSKWSEIYFLDDNKTLDTVLGIKIIGQSSHWMEYLTDHDIFVAIGNNEARRGLIEQLEISGATIPLIIHPSAIIGSSVELGKGTVVMAGVVINCCTRIGKGCIINTSCSIDHDCNIGDYVHVSPGVRVAGSVVVGDMVWLGVNSTVINNIKITKKCIIGAGATVVSNLLDTGTYVGIPTRRIK